MEKTVVTVLGCQVLCAFNSSTTVADLAQQAFTEWQRTNRNGLKRIRCTKDSNGRVLPGWFKVQDLDSRDEFMVDIEDLLSENKVDMEEVMTKYRMMQVFTVQQIHANIATIHFQTAGQEPDDTSLLLIRELVCNPCQEVQRELLSVLQLLILKFSSKKTHAIAISLSVQLFKYTEFVDIAIDVLNLLKHASCQLVSLINANTIAQLDLEATVSRFPDHQSDILTIADQISANVTAFATEMRSTYSVPDLHVHGERRPRKGLAGVSDTSTTESSHSHSHGVNSNQASKESLMKYTPSAPMFDARPSAFMPSQPNTAHGGSRLIHRLLKMVSSTDISVRQFGLSRLLKRLQTQVDEQLTRWRDADFGTEENYRWELYSSCEVVQQQHYHQHQHTHASISEDLENSVDSGSVVVETIEDLTALSSGLLQALRTSLDSRAAASLPGGGKDSESKLKLENTSTAALLIECALNSSSTDLTSVKYCLCILHLLQLVELQQVYHPIWLFTYHDCVLESIQSFGKLLTTLSNAHDSCIAEIAAQIVFQAVLYAGRTCKSGAARELGVIAAGWSSTGWKMEAASLLYFFRSPPLHQFRVSLALSFLLFLSRSTDLSTGDSGQASSLSALPAVSIGANKRNQPAAPMSFQAMLSHDSFKMISRLLNLAVDTAVSPASFLSSSSDMFGGSTSLGSGRTVERGVLEFTSASLKSSLLDNPAVHPRHVSVTARAWALECVASASVRSEARQVLKRVSALDRVLSFIQSLGDDSVGDSDVCPPVVLTEAMHTDEPGLDQPRRHPESKDGAILCLLRLSLKTMSNLCAGEGVDVRVAARDKLATVQFLLPTFHSGRMTVNDLAGIDEVVQFYLSLLLV